MPSQRELRNAYLFFGGVMLGIIGNMLVEYFIAFLYPYGIPTDAAQGGTIIMTIIFFAYLLLFVHLSR